MAADIVSLEPAVHEIFTAPGVDMSTISAKRVRRQLLAQNPDMHDWIRDNKDAINALITKVFTQLQPLALEDEAGPSESHQSPEGTQEVEEDEDSEDEDEDAEMEEQREKRPAKKPRKKRPLTDEEYAKQLSSEINGRTRSSRSGASTPKRSRGGRSKGSRRNISAVTIDSDDDGDEKVGKKRKKSSGGGARGGFSKEYILSEPLAVVIQVERLSRPQVVKKLWEYIKGNDLQNPRNKREILCDTSLRAVFGQDKIDMFTMNKVLGHHLTEP